MLKISINKILKYCIVLLSITVSTLSANPIKIMFLGDSITSGAGPQAIDPEANASEYYEANSPNENIPYEDRFAYRKELSKLLIKEGYTIGSNESQLDFVGTVTKNNSDFDEDNEGYGGITSYGLLHGRVVSLEDNPTGIDGNISRILNDNIPDIVLLHIGTNDPGNDIPIGTLDDTDEMNTTVSNVRQILNKIFAKNQDAKIFLARIIEARRVDKAFNGKVWTTKDLNDAIENMVKVHQNTANIKMVDMESGAGMIYNPCGLTLGDMQPFHSDDNNRYDYHPNPNGYAKMASKWLADMNASKWLPDIFAPTITLNGSTPQQIVLDDKYTELGATVTDNKDTNLTAMINATAVDTAVEGNYTVSYNATDTAGNTAVEVNRTIVVSMAPDTEPPVITLAGTNPVNLEFEGIYTEEGATAEDDVDGNLTVVVAGDTVNTAVSGTYTVTYNVSDTAGNPALELTRTVIVAPDPAADTNENGIPDNEEQTWFSYEKATQTVTLVPMGSIKIAQGLNANPKVDEQGITLSHIMTGKEAYITALSSAEVKTGFKEGAIDDPTLSAGNFTSGTVAEIKQLDDKVIIEITKVKLNQNESLIIGGK